MAVAKNTRKQRPDAGTAGMYDISVAPRTLYDKIWQRHVIRQKGEELSLLYIDRHLVHEVTSPQAFEGLRQARRRVRRPDLTLAMPDHNVSTSPRGSMEVNMDPASAMQIEALRGNCLEFGITLLDVHDVRQGIVHVVGPEQGLILPGLTVVCGDSHTASHGALGALAFGIGTTQVEHVLATQTLYQRRSKTMRIRIDGTLAPGVSAKDVALHMAVWLGSGGANGHVIEYCGDVIDAMSLESRLTLCNMAIEVGARSALIAPDDVTFAYLHQRPLAPKGDDWDRAVIEWRLLFSDPEAAFDEDLQISGSEIEFMVSWGTSSADVVPASGTIPDPLSTNDVGRRQSMIDALAYMGLEPKRPVNSIPIDVAFIGSCTNGRIEDLREAARVLEGRRVSSDLQRAFVVPGSGLVKRQAEAEGLDRIFQAAGFQWREAGCSACLGMNEDRILPRQRCASTSNRNFEGRQGYGARTHLMSPAMVAASAVAGRICAPQELK